MFNLEGRQSHPKLSGPARLKRDQENGETIVNCGILFFAYLYTLYQNSRKKYWLTFLTLTYKSFGRPMRKTHAKCNETIYAFSHNEGTNIQTDEMHLDFASFGQ